MPSREISRTSWGESWRKRRSRLTPGSTGKKGHPLKIRNDRLSYSAWRKFKEGPDSYVLYLMGLELRSPYAAAGKAYHQQVAGALMGGYDHSPQVDTTITGAIERGIVT